MNRIIFNNFNKEKTIQYIYFVKKKSNTILFRLISWSLLFIKNKNQHLKESYKKKIFSHQIRYVYN